MPNADADVPQIVKRRQLPHETTLVELSNGLTVIVQENTTAPVASVRCFVKNTGSAFEERWLGCGISHLLEHLVAGGTTTKRTEKEIEHAVERIGGVTNAFTSDDMTCYFIDSTAENVPLTVELVADMMQRVVFEQSEFDREFKVVNQELQDGLNDRNRVLWNTLAQTTYLESTARHPIIGYQDLLGKLTRDDVVAFYKDRYVPNNMVFIVVGDVKTEEVLRLVAANFAGTPRGREHLIPLVDEPMQLSPRSGFREMDGQTYHLVFAWPTVKLSDPDLYALDVASYILSEGESSRLTRSLVYEKQLLLSVGTYSHTPHFVKGSFCAIAVGMPEKQEEAARELLAAVDLLRREPVTAKELEKAKKQKEAELVFGRQGVGEIASSLGRSFIATGDPLYDLQYVEGIRKVTAGDILRVAKKYFVPECLNTITIVPTGMGPKPSAESATAAKSDTTFHKLPNGLRVVVRKQANLPLVTVQAFVFGATLTESEATAGRSALLAAMLDKGTKTQSAEQIADYFDSVGGVLSMSSGRNTIYGSATVLAADFETAAGRFADCFLGSTFPNDEFDQIKTLALGRIARRTDNPMSELMEFFVRQLPKGSPYSHMEDGTVESVGPLTVDALKKQYAAQFVPSNMVVTVFGDIEPAAALKIVEKSFGALPASTYEHQTLMDPKNCTIRESKAFHKKTQKDSGAVLLAWNSPSIRDKEDYAAMRVLSAILSDGTGPNGLLFNELRGQGLVYRVNTSLRTGPVAGFFLTIAQTQPENVAEVVERIENNIALVKEGRFTKDDFERAKERLISRHKQSNVTISEQAMQAGLDELYDMGYDYDKTFPDRIAAVTFEQVAAAAQKYLTERYVVTASSNDK